MTEENLVNPPPSPVVAEYYQHIKSGQLYQIMQTKIELAGKLRDLYSSGYVHVYQCQKTGKFYARLTDEWERESKDFIKIPRSNKLIDILGGE